MSDFLKNPLLTGAAILAIFVGYAELRLPGLVDAEMNSRGLVSTGDFERAKEDIKEQKAKHDADTEEWKRRIERIVEILLEE